MVVILCKAEPTFRSSIYFESKENCKSITIYLSPLWCYDLNFGGDCNAKIHCHQALKHCHFGIVASKLSCFRLKAVKLKGES